jgi:uncharacterized SAM-binding protein YcdF (DUF218 family)
MLRHLPSFTPVPPGLLLWMMVMLFSGCNLYHEISLENTQRPVYDAVIVPGFPFEDEDGALTGFHKMRLFWAYHLYKNGETRNIIVSGGAVHSPFVEAEVMAMHLREMGVDPRDIYIENRAEHSTENVFYSLEIARNAGFKKVAVATDPWQSRMISFLMRKTDLEVDYLPADVATVGSEYWRAFGRKVDARPAMVSNFVPLKEREERTERMRGTKGEKYLLRLKEEHEAPSETSSTR